MTFGVGGILGPVLGGVILAIASWRWVFFINLPIGVFGTYFSYRCLRKMPRPNMEETLDLLGVITFSVSLFSLLLALMLGIQLGWRAAPVWLLLGVFLLTLLFFIWLGTAGAVSGAGRPALLQPRLQFLRAGGLFSIAGDVRGAISHRFLPASGARRYAAACRVAVIPMPAGLGDYRADRRRISDKIGALVPRHAGYAAAGPRRLLVKQPHLISTSTAYRDRIGAYRAGGAAFFSPNTSAAMSTAPPGAPGRRRGHAGHFTQYRHGHEFRDGAGGGRGSIPRQRCSKSLSARPCT